MLRRSASKVKFVEELRLLRSQRRLKRSAASAKLNRKLRLLESKLRARNERTNKNSPNSRKGKNVATKTASGCSNEANIPAECGVSRSGSANAGDNLEGKFNSDIRTKLKSDNSLPNASVSYENKSEFISQNNSSENHELISENCDRDKSVLLKMCKVVLTRIELQKSFTLVKKENGQALVLGSFTSNSEDLNNAYVSDEESKMKNGTVAVGDTSESDGDQARFITSPRIGGIKKEKSSDEYLRSLLEGSLTEDDRGIDERISKHLTNIAQGSASEEIKMEIPYPSDSEANEDFLPSKQDDDEVMNVPRVEGEETDKKFKEILQYNVHKKDVKSLAYKKADKSTIKKVLRNKIVCIEEMEHIDHVDTNGEDESEINAEAAESLLVTSDDAEDDSKDTSSKKNMDSSTIEQQVKKKLGVFGLHLEDLVNYLDVQHLVDWKEKNPNSLLAVKKWPSSTSQLGHQLMRFFIVEVNKS